MAYADDSRRRSLAGGFTTEQLLWGAILAAAYLISRLYAVTHIPVFIDEAIHVDWARATAESYPPSDPGFDGRWLSIKLFALTSSLGVPFNELIAARLSVVALGLATALACYLIGRDLFSPRAGALGVALYVVLPFSLIYSSLAMADGVQLAFGSWATFLAVRSARTGRWAYALALPLALAAAVLAKFSGLMLLGLPVAAVLLLTPRTRWAGAALRAVPALLTPLGLLALFYSRGMLQVVRVKIMGNPAPLVELVSANLASAGEWLWGLLTPSVAVSAAVAVGWLLACERSRAGLFVVTLLGLAVIPYVVISQIWFPRYLLPAVVPVSLAVGRLLDGAVALAQRRWGSGRAPAAAVIALLLAGVLGWPTLRSGAVLFALPEAGLPWLERYQLVTGWPSGYGVRELAAFLREQGASTPGGIMVARTFWADHPLQSLNLYLTPSPSLSLYTVGDDNESSVKYLTWMSTKRRTLLVLSTDHGVPQRLRQAATPLVGCGRPIWSYTRPGGATGFVVLELSCGTAAAR